MNRLLLFFAILTVALATACEDDDSFTGSSNITTEERNLNGFAAIDISNALDVRIVQAADFSVSVSANDNLQQRVLTEVNSGLLELGLASGSYRNADITVTVALPTLRSLALNDATEAEVNGFADLDALTLVLNSASDLDVTNSSVRALDVQANAASELRAFGLQAEIADINASAASDLRLSVSDRLTGRAADASEVIYRGNPTVEVEVTEASTVRRE